MIIDSYDPDDPLPGAATSGIVYLHLSSDVDELVADDDLTLAARKTDYLSSLLATFQTNRIVDSLGHAYYLVLDSQRLILFN